MVGCDVKFKECGLVDNRSLLLVLWLRGWQLAQQTLVHIHRCGDKEEYQQHKRNVGCRCGIQSRYSMWFTQTLHFFRSLRT